MLKQSIIKYYVVGCQIRKKLLWVENPAYKNYLSPHGELSQVAICSNYLNKIITFENSLVTYSHVPIGNCESLKDDDPDCCAHSFRKSLTYE